MLSPTWATVRLFLHVLAACVWVGGQLVLGGLVPVLRATSPDAPRAAARMFNKIAWPAYGVLLATGAWNLTSVHLTDTTTAYQITVFVKVLAVAVSGIAALVHTQANGRRLALALGGALAGLGGLAALFLGILLHVH